jgi:hypothetical protein
MSRSKKSFCEPGSTKVDWDTVLQPNEILTSFGVKEVSDGEPQGSTNLEKHGN